MTRRGDDALCAHFNSRATRAGRMSAFVWQPAATEVAEVPPNTRQQSGGGRNRVNMPSLDRRSLLFGAIIVALNPTLISATERGHSPHILFVCQFGTVKSPVARELLKRRAIERHIAVEAMARGITPGDHTTPELLNRLANDRINPAAEPLRKLGPEDIAKADIVIAFDKLPAEYHPRRLEDWSDLPSMVNDYDHARAVLDPRIEKLLDRLLEARP